MTLKPSIKKDFITYPIPDFLSGRCTHTVYIKWLNNKADTLLKRDKKRGKAYARIATKSLYKKKIHQAVFASGTIDPYTGETLAWELISKWDSHEHPDGYKKKFYLMPTVDHVTPDVLEFEICSWKANDAKSDMSPKEFVEFCGKVAKFRRIIGARRAQNSING
jgi:hypothetical protein